MRLAIIAAAGASATPNPKVGERDAMLIRERLAMEDMGFVVHVLDPELDMAEQLDSLLAKHEGPFEDVLLYASALVAVVDDGECFLCLDPEQPDVGDALRDVGGVIAQRSAGNNLAIIEARFDDAHGDQALMQQVMHAIQQCVDSAATGIELITSVRSVGAHNERIPSRLTAGLLEAIDSREGSMTARKAYALAIQQTDFGGWPSAVGYTPIAWSLQLRDLTLIPPELIAPSSHPARSQPNIAPDFAPPISIPATPSADREPTAEIEHRPQEDTPVPVVSTDSGDKSLLASQAEIPLASAVMGDKSPDGAPCSAPAHTRRVVPEESPPTVPTAGFSPPANASPPAGFSPATEPAAGFEPPSVPPGDEPPSVPPGFEPPSVPPGNAPSSVPPGDAPPATLGFEEAPPATLGFEDAPSQAAAPSAPEPESRPRKSSRRPPPPSERSQSATVSVRLGKSKPKDATPLPKVVISPRADPRKKDTLRKMEQAMQAHAGGGAMPPEVPEALKETASEGPAAKRTQHGLEEPEEISIEEEIHLPPQPPTPPPKSALPASSDAPAPGERKLPPRRGAADAEPQIPQKKKSEWTVDDHIQAGDAELASGFVDKAMAEYKKGLGKLGTTTTPARAEIYIRMAQLMRKRGKVRVASSNYEKALHILPTDERALGGLIELHAEQENWRSVNSTEQKFFEHLDADDPRRLELLLASGKRWLNQADDTKRAKERFVTARDAFPKSIEPLEHLLELFEKQKALDHVLDTRRRIAALADDPTQRAQIYFELGEYCMFETQREEDAFAAFELALDSDPMMLEALEVLATALADGQEWGELERVYLKMKNIFLDRTDDASRIVLAELHHNLALMYRDHLEDHETALKSLDDEIALFPDRISAILLAADVAEALNDPAKELVYLRDAATLEPRRVNTYERLFSLGQRHDETETAFHAASALSVLGSTDERARILYDEHRVEGVPMHVRPLRPEAWVWLRVSDRDASVDRVMRAVAPAVFRARVMQLESDGKLPKLPGERQDPETSTISSIRSIAWGSQFLGMQAPAIYIDEGSLGALSAPFAKHQVIVLGKGALSGRSVRELAFLVGRHLALRLPEHVLVAHMSSMEELSACFLAAMKIVLGAAPTGKVDATVVEALARVLDSQMSEEERAALQDAVRQFSQAGGRVDLNRWVRSVDKCATRTGYVLCGDLETAVDIITDEGNSPFSTVQERVDDLLSFALGGSNMKLRQELGSSVTPAGERPILTQRGGSVS